VQDHKPACRMELWRAPRLSCLDHLSNILANMRSLLSLSLLPPIHIRSLCPLTVSVGSKASPLLGKCAVYGVRVRESERVSRVFRRSPMANPGSSGRRSSSELTARFLIMVAVGMIVLQIFLNAYMLPTINENPRTISTYSGGFLPVSSSKEASEVSDGQVATHFTAINPRDFEDIPVGRYRARYYSGADLAPKSENQNVNKWRDIDVAKTGEYKRIHFLPHGKKKGHRAKLAKGKNSAGLTEEFPPAPVNLNEFYAEFSGIFRFKSGQYRMVTSTTGAVRVFVNNVLVFDDWRPRSSPKTNSNLVHLKGGQHAIRVEFRHFSTVHAFEHLKAFHGGDEAFLAAGKEKWQEKAAGFEIPSLAFKIKPDDFGLTVYVYDLPPSYNVDIVKENPQCRTHMFAPEVYIHEMLLKSSIRTKDPREADLFYVPTYTSCKYLGRGMFGVDPWFGKRLVHSAVELISRKYPYWNRHKGQDHIFSMTYDYGACFEYKYDKADNAGVLREIHSSILLSIISDTTNSCFRPSTDVVVPAMVSRTDMLARLKPPDEEKGVLLSDTSNAQPPVEKTRDIFVYFQGSIEWGVDKDPDYSRGVRRAIKEHHGKDPLFLLGEGKSSKYVDTMSRSLFCLCPLGFAVWSPRIYESVIMGCIPVIIGDGIRLPFDWELDWRDFSVKIPEWRIKKGELKQILGSIPSERIAMKQQALAQVRKSVAYVPDGIGDPRAPDAFGYLARELRAKAHSPQLIQHPSDADFWV
jgi:hypothetical protein